MSKPNPKLEQLKRLARPILEATGEHFCDLLDGEVDARLAGLDREKTEEASNGVIRGLRAAVLIIRKEYQL